MSAFGDVVSVKAISRRVLRDEDRSSGRTKATYRERSEPISQEIAETAEWPEFDGKCYARICREVLPLPAFGIIVGQTKRVEGHREEGYTAGDAYGEPYEEPPYFVGSKVVSVYEVALMVGPHRKALVVLVQPDDLRVLLADPSERLKEVREDLDAIQTEAADWAEQNTPEDGEAPDGSWSVIYGIAEMALSALTEDRDDS